MPLYEYQCEACALRFERIQKFSDPPIAVCPECGGAVRKLLSSPAIQFKGAGWYITDYARKGGKAESSKGEGAAGDGGKREGAKSDGAAKDTAKADTPKDQPTKKSPSA